MRGFLVWIAACLAAAIAALTGTVAAAQTAPAGNAHPETVAITGAAEATNPFGGPGVSASPMDLRAKESFAESVDLAPLRDLAVYHNGRVKILETLARETVATIVGRRDFVAFEPGPDGEARKIHFDPLFTYLDLQIDPAFYLSQPLVHVEFLPLREAFLEAIYTDASEKEWWKRVGRLKPLDLERASQAVVAGYGSEAPYLQGLSRVARSMELYRFSWQNLVMIAPDAADKPWHHLSELGPETAAGRAVRELGEAWRAGDGARVNAAAAALGAELPRINPAFYPETKRRVEAAYNRANAFEWGFWMYALSLVSLMLAFGTGRRWLVRLGLTTLGVALSLHAAGFVARCLIAERFAIQNQFESMTGLSLFAVIVGTVIMLIRRQWLFGAAAAAVGFMVLVTATQTGIPGVSVEREAPILNTSVLLKYHVTTVLVSYGLISLGFVISLFYLGTHYAASLRAAAGRERLALAGAGMGSAGGLDAGALEVSASALGLDEGAPKGPARILSDLDTAQMIVLQLAFWTLGVGILLGAWWADHSWGRWWAFDPKELFALVTWIVYLIVIHLRLVGGHNRGLTTAWLSVVGFVVMLWTYFGVNLLLPGLHAYA